MNNSAICNDTRFCFAKNLSSGRCEILIQRSANDKGYPNGKCPFCKPERNVTNDKYYPYNSAYLKR